MSKTEKLSTRLTGPDLKAFKKLAQKQNRNVADLLRILVKQAIEAR